MRTPENLIMHELIGLEVEVVESTDRRKKGLKGVVMDETANTLVILTKGKEGKKKVISKKECTFMFKLDKEKVEVEGWTILARPEERTKKAARLLTRWRVPAQK